MGKQKVKQESLWITAEKVTSPANAFYQQLNDVLTSEKFDRRVEFLCKKYYKGTKGRPSMAPGVYFRMLFIGYFEGLDSERGIAWRTADSLSLRRFLGFSLEEGTPDHSTVSRTRRLLSVETHKAVFRWVLRVLVRRGLLKGQTICIDATSLEANAALKSLVRRDSGQPYEEWLRELAKAEGIENPTREQLARFDRKRKRKASNQDWENPYDPDARITKMKDGRTHLAYKAEHAVDLESGALVAVTVQPADRGDTTSYQETLREAQAEVTRSEPLGIEEIVADKGYHSGEVLRQVKAQGIRSYIPEPDRGNRHWEGKAAEQKNVYANRRRVRGDRGKRLQKLRGELTERSFAHVYDTGGMRRVHLRGRNNISKRLAIHAGAFNLGLVMRRLLGVGKPRQMTSCRSLFSAFFAAFELLPELISTLRRRRSLIGSVLAFQTSVRSSARRLAVAGADFFAITPKQPFTTGC